MTVKLIAIYSQPTDAVAFNHHYDTVHAPLVEQIPGLQSMTVNRIENHLMGDIRPYMIVEMVYADQSVFDAAMASPENRATGKDVMGFAKDLVSLMVAKN